MSSVQFPWETLKAIIGGESAIDVPRLQVYSLQEASDFLANYGFRCSVPLHNEEMERIRKEAIEFLESKLLKDEPSLSIPPEIRGQTDVRQLLLWASSKKRDDHQRWTCTLLRLMHTIAHGPSHFDEQFGEQIRSQILQRYAPHLHKTDNGEVLGDGEDSIPLVMFEIKRAKPKHSLIMKLLHKPENVAADVFDHIGVRFVTRDRYDALLVVRYLRSHNVFMFANVKPSRSRNTLIDLDWLREQTQRLQERTPPDPYEESGMVRALRLALEAMPYPGPPEKSSNPFSSRRYHSMQFTCRQMIRIQNPYATSVVAKMEALPSESELELQQVLLQDLEREKEIRFFFPYEIQIMDRKSYEQSRYGMAAHSKYKRRQLESVKRRVLGDLLPPQPPSGRVDLPVD